MMKSDMQQITCVDHEIYLRPGRAHKIMKTAQDISKTVYIYGVSGSGKTSFIKDYVGRKEYMYLSAENLTVEDLKNVVLGRKFTEYELNNYFEVWQLNFTEDDIRMLAEISKGLVLTTKIIAI